MQGLDELLEQAKTAIHAATDLAAIEACKVQFLGKKGLLTGHLQQLGRLTPAERPVAGQRINIVKEAIQDLFDARTRELNQLAIAQQLASEAVDITLPGRDVKGKGSIHPLSQTFAELRHIFTQMGFTCLAGPEVEDDYYNFTALNVPPLHPARAMQDTFYFLDGKLLRSQMSPVQIHAMQKMSPPMRMIAMGRVYRRDFDLTHTPMFHQIECLMVDEDISFAHLKGLLTEFLRTFFSPDVIIRFRPSYFPFTEPSAEVDISCFSCQQRGCRICKQTGWLEVLGCGMVHPNVLREVKIDPAKYRGFAFGAGIDRLTMLKYGITDLRALFENDIRFLAGKT